ncbi:MAG: pheromone processing endoprotease [Alyxoria varia]|nr:MAG: pheromone processing endoprotease [Alyxoria varia]
MRYPLLAAVLSLISAAFSEPPLPRNYDTHDYYAVHLHSKRSPSDVAEHLGLEYHAPLGTLKDHYLLKYPKHDHDIVKRAVDAHKIQKRSADASYQNHILDDLLFHQKQILKPPKVKRTPLPPSPPFGTRRQSHQDQGNEEAIAKGKEVAKVLEIEDPIFHDQWHLHNTVQVGHDLNVTGVWMDGITGKNATVCIIDDGIDMTSADIKDNYFSEGSYDFNDQREEPSPLLDDDKHGTRCAGEVAAVKNDVCGVGVAWNAKVGGIRILSKAINDADEAEAMTYGYQKTDIYSCSWGPPDTGEEMGAPGILIKRAFVDAIQNGRGGRGTIYVFAAGNGAAADDNCNFDGYTNSIYSITIGAIDREGKHPYYSEKCSAQLAVTYSSGSGDAIHTTDVGTNSCYVRHGGTSAAGPLAAGVYALIVQVRPDLTWRDMQWLTVMTAIPVENDDADHQETAMGKRYSHQYGFGKLDSWALVSAAKSWKNVKPQAWLFSPWQHVRHQIPQGEVGLSSTFRVTEEMLKTANLDRIEHVTVTMNVNHTRRGDVSVDLKSPHGVISHLSTARKHDEFEGGYTDWTFMSVASFGEKPQGEWTIIVKDTVENDHEGTFVDWKLNLFGEAKDGDNQDLLPMPTEHDDDDHDREDAAVTTTTVGKQTKTEKPGGNPTDHIHRPVNQKPTDTGTATEATATTAFEAPVAAGSRASSTELPSVETSSASRSDSFLPSPFPTFGVSKRTQIWIYGAVGLIVIFCGCLAAYFYMAQRKRLRNSRDHYEFDVLNSDDDDQDWGMGGRRGGKKGKRRAGELYDAFAGEGESDEDLFSDDEKDGYRDEDGENSPKPREKRGLSSSDEESSGSGSGPRTNQAL